MQDTNSVSYGVAFLSGMLIFLSPCILPLIPSYISYLTGISFQDLKDGSTKEEKHRIKIVTFLHALMFVLGFSVVFVLLGTTVTFFGQFLLDYQDILKKAGAVLIIVFGLMIMGVLKLGFLEKEKRITYKKTNVTYLGSLLVGATFALAWTPCVGPILGSILVYASSTASMKQGVMLLSIFSLGLGLPFILAALLFNSFLLYFNKLKSYIIWVNRLGGAILVVFGILILTRGIR